MCACHRQWLLFVRSFGLFIVITCCSIVCGSVLLILGKKKPVRIINGFFNSFLLGKFNFSHANQKVPDRIGATNGLIRLFAVLSVLRSCPNFISSFVILSSLNVRIQSIKRFKQLIGMEISDCLSKYLVSTIVIQDLRLLRPRFDQGLRKLGFGNYTRQYFRVD